MDQGTSWVLVVPLVGLLVELLAVRFWVSMFYTTGLPLMQEPLPLPVMPEGEGQTAAVDWRVDEDRGCVLWRGGGSRREGLTGLRGVIWLNPTRRGVQLQVVWAPPWSAVVAALALVWLGVLRGTPTLTLPMASLILGGTALVYYQGALRVAGELRYALVSGGTDLEEPDGE